MKNELQGLFFFYLNRFYYLFYNTNYNNIIKLGIRESVDAEYKMIVNDIDSAKDIIKKFSDGSEIKTVDTIIREKHLKEISFKTSPENIPELVKNLVENGVQVWSVRPIETSLEDAYLDATGGGQIA